MTPNLTNECNEYKQEEESKEFGYQNKNYINCYYKRVITA